MRDGMVIAAVALGGALGSLARWALVAALPAAAPWSTFGVNLAGCLLIGVLVAAVVRFDGAPILRPMLGTGVLGGFTTFSGYAVDGTGLLVDGRYLAAAAYLAGTPAGAVLAAALGVALVEWLPWGDAR
jgi:CrcB protein